MRSALSHANGCNSGSTVGPNIYSDHRETPPFEAGLMFNLLGEILKTQNVRTAALCSDMDSKYETQREYSSLWLSSRYSAKATVTCACVQTLSVSAARMTIISETICAKAKSCTNRPAFQLKQQWMSYQAGMELMFTGSMTKI